MNISRFTAEDSLYRSSGNYRLMVDINSEIMTNVLPQMRYLGCRALSSYCNACGVEDDETQTSHWVVVCGNRR